MPLSPFDIPRTFGVDADRLSDAEFFLRLRCDKIAAEVRGIIVCGGIEFGSP